MGKHLAPFIFPGYLDFNFAFARKHMPTVRAGPAFDAHFAAVGMEVRLLHAAILSSAVGSAKGERAKGEALA